MKWIERHRVAAPPSAVWAALCDPGVLQICVPGCETLIKSAEQEYRGVVAVQIGPVRGRFSGVLTQRLLDKPRRAGLLAVATGGAAGSVRGTAEIVLEDRGGSTLLTCELDVAAAGKLASLGPRLVEEGARRLSASFFQALVAHLAGVVAPAPNGLERR